eukprot:ANDGO_04460.mRNA.1 putative RNA pseudouridine synthase ZMO0505
MVLQTSGPVVLATLSVASTLPILECLRRALQPLGYSRRTISRLFASGKISVVPPLASPGSTTLPKGEYSVMVTDDALRLTTQGEPVGEFAQPASPVMPALSVVYEDECVVVSDKPAGIPSAPVSPVPVFASQNSALPTTRDASSMMWPSISSASAVGSGQDDDARMFVRDKGLVHRLDNGTSGCLLFARFPAVHKLLRSMWSFRSSRQAERSAIGKTYRAWIAIDQSKHWDVRRVPFSLQDEIAHHPTDRSRMYINLPALGPITDSTETRRSVVQTVHAVSASGRFADVSVVLCGPGARHQIRLHLAQSLQAPILGDPLYSLRRNPHPLVGRMYLHAWRVSLPKLYVVELHDGLRGCRIGDEHIESEAPLPREWDDVQRFL